MGKSCNGFYGNIEVRLTESFVFHLQKIKTLDNRISDMKKTLQRELLTSKSDLSTAEEQDISRR